MFKFNTDNIGYVLMEPSTRSLIAIDLGEFEISHKVITEIETTQRAQLKYILTTHHHNDHQGGNKQWKELRGNQIEIVTGNLMQYRFGNMADFQLKDLQTMTVGEICICAMETPGHTAEHVSYIITHVTPESTKTPFLFSGDTLFVGGCGRLLDQEFCTAEHLFYSLQKLINLPNETLLFCGHEYTEANLKFAKYIEPSNPMIDHKLKQV